MYSDEVVYKAIAKLEAGEKPGDVADQLKVGKGSVIRWYSEFRTARDNNTLDTMFNMESLILATAGKLASENSEFTEVVEAKTAELTKGLKGLARLDDELQTTALAVNTKIRSLIMATESPSELADLTDCLCNIRKAFFEKGTQVNVQNNFSGESKYRELIND